jgi:DNA-binding transcriptional regulator YhcF (GntR family)
MHFRLNRKSPLPIHVQLKAQLAHLIQAGEWLPGRRLPTVRQLAGSLRINRNTASRVFADLAREGHLSCERGRGTFVSPRRAGGRRERTRELLLLLDEALGRARRLGFSPAGFAAALFARAHATAGAARLRKARILAVECDRPRLRRLSRELAEALPLRVDSLLIRDLGRQVRRDPRSLRKYPPIVTTVLHVRELQRLMGGTGRGVVGLPADDRLRRVLRHVPVVDRAGIEILRRRLARGSG